MFSNNYHYVLLSYTKTLLHQCLINALSTCVLFILLMQSLNGTQFLNITSLPLLTTPGASAVTDIVPLKTIYASL